MLWNIPIENLEERYSSQWNVWFPQEFQKANLEFQTIYPDNFQKNKINIGSFLDVYSSNRFKALQLSMICQLFEDNKVKDDDIFFFHDLWFPGIEMLFYIRDGSGIKFKIMGCLHAGTYDPWDFLTQSGMMRWAARIETSWFREVDKIFVATHFHKDLILENRKILESKIAITSFPLFLDIEYDKDEKEDIIIFPHRMNKEKQPELFIKLKEQFKNKYPAWKFLFTKEECKTKEEYYSLLKKAKVAVSFAQQETWGIAQQEAMFLGCIPVVPNRLSYHEMYYGCFKYNTLSGVYTLVESYMNNYSKVINDSSAWGFKRNLSKLKENNRQSIPNMILYFKGVIND